MAHKISEVRCKMVSVEVILDLRHRVLRAGMRAEAACFDGDHEPDTQHFAAYFDGGIDPVGCASFMLRPYNRIPAWQLRGMATEERYRGRKIGAHLLEWAVMNLKDEPDYAYVELLWCNAREPAVPFYERNGWRCVSGRFVIDDAGPHYKMIKSI